MDNNIEEQLQQFQTSLIEKGEMSAADIFWSCIAILFFTGCLILLWS